MFRIEAIDLEFSNGSRRQFERLAGSTHGAVAIVAMPDDETVLLIREYAAGTGNYELGLPKGLIENSEDILDAANRELKEETGYGARSLEQISTLTVSPAYFGHRTRIVLATGLYPDKIEGDEPEPLEVIPWRLDKLDELLERDDFTEARSVAALFMVRNRLGHD